MSQIEKPANLNYHITIKNSQAILKCFIDLRFSVWFTLRSENSLPAVRLSRMNA